MALIPQLSRPKVTQLTSFKLGPYRVTQNQIATTLQGSEFRVLNKSLLTLTPAAVGANTTAGQVFNLAGLAPGDVIVAVNKPTEQAGLGLVGARYYAAGQLVIVFANTTAGAITPTAAEVYTVLVLR